MLYSLLLVAVQGRDTLARFEDFWKRTNSFSAQIEATSLAAGQGKGTLIVVKPSTSRVTMKWPNEDYTVVKTPEGMTEYERLSKMYMLFPPGPGLRPYDSSVADYQQESLVLPLLAGTFRVLIPDSATIAGAKAEAGAQSVTATWKTMDGGAGKLVAKIGADGKLLALDHRIETLQGTIHRQFKITNYVIPAKPAPKSFSLIPPLGFTLHHRLVEYLDFSTGDRPKFGTWKSSGGQAQLEEAARGKLLIVREPASPPADRLIAYLKTQKLPVKSIVASLGTSGGDYWNPSPAMAKSLAMVGTPLSILMSKDGVALAIWVGFDFDNPEQMIRELKEALEENSGE